ncbi:MAG: DUF4214 domain-containing protein [Acidimicrobiales bacterium]
MAASAEAAAFHQTNCEHLSDAVYRLYQAAFGRAPDEQGFTYWLARYTSADFPLRSQAGYFIESDEFASLYGDADRRSLCRQPVPQRLGSSWRRRWAGLLD